jgi:DNA repair exonuclease SbcCD ATPase subunit
MFWKKKCLTLISKDILTNSTVMLHLFSAALLRYASHEMTIREHMKAVRTREENLDELRKHRKSAASRTDSAEKKLSKMGSDHKNLLQQQELLVQLKEQVRALDEEIMTEEASLGDFKRESTKDWMSLKFGGLSECSEKGTVRTPFFFFPAFNS